MSGILHLVAIAISTLADDSGDFLRLQANEGGLPDGARVLDAVPVFAHYGFASVPPIGSRLLLVRGAGDRSRSMVAGSNHNETRLRDLQPGDSAMHDMRGQFVKLTAEGLEIDCQGLPAIIRNASKLRCECDIETTGDVISRADDAPVSLNALRDAYHAHTHAGVSVGSASTGGPTPAV